MRTRSSFFLGLGAAFLLAACSGNYAADDSYQTPAPKVGQNAQVDPDDTLFGEDGFTMGGLLDGSIFGAEDPLKDGGRLPINKYIWQGTLETLDFLPLASADPFTGVIATEWSTTPQSPGQRFKVAAYVTSPDLEASSLKVAVFREDLREDGLWIPMPVSEETVRRLEDAILTRSRQIRIAELEAAEAS
ncbi:DUF3576 domain-containing protein [Paralimibaculum aggregatum]|uniref:DUF3576 domain-containing protein n=1 Tax=Paralimibaculum aggregatum TaxID=3036245 RepID=A0ABQ6LTF5_9RHOB|nr:DUF3576 domain-containing protein [Limibaculum sp. NKW23]GMG85368.1 DUF3576 domain-containing protein [Limibaculum sp. NKW23]